MIVRARAAPAPLRAASLVKADSVALPLADDSVVLIVTSRSSVSRTNTERQGTLL